MLSFFLISVWNTLGVSNSQICRDIREPMSQEFVTELDDHERKLNEEIDYLLEGIDFQQSLSQEKSPLTVSSTLPEENGYTSVHHEDIARDECMSSPLLFTQEKKEKEETKSTVPIIQHFTCSEEKSPVHFEDTMDILEEVPVSDIGDTYLSDEHIQPEIPSASY